MTTPPTPQDPREIAKERVELWLSSRAATSWAFSAAELADAVLAAVSPVIRQQVAEEIAHKITALCRVHPTHFPYTVLGTSTSDMRTARNVRDAVAAQAAAIARSHSTHPGEETK